MNITNLSQDKQKVKKKKDLKFQILVSSFNLKCNNFKVNGVFIISHGEKSSLIWPCIYPNNF